MGIICDKYGRKYTLFYGICVISISLALMPLSTSIYPMYLVFRILYAHGGITISIVPLLADYVTNMTKVFFFLLLSFFIKKFKREKEQL
jgi:MFS family permease